MPTWAYRLALCTLLATDLPVSASAQSDELRAFLDSAVKANPAFADPYDAQVWFVDMHQRLARFLHDPLARVTILRHVHTYAKASNLPPELVLAVIHVESGFDRFAVSSAGAQGYMQVMPFWKYEIGRPGDNLMQTETNLRYGCRILEYYVKRAKGDLHQALAAYNGSTGSRMYSNKVREYWQQYWRVEPLDW
jgi:soluble lytic murein transglycosylase-like protein